jgi:Rrf2 family protein
MLALTKKTGYGLIAMSHLAGLPEGDVASAASIADLFGVPKALLMNVLKELAAAGFVQSVRGAGGGYRLARRPRDIRLAELTGAVERPVRLAECVTRAARDRQCTREMMARCPVADPVHRFHRKLNDFLQKVSLEEILNPPLTAPGPPSVRPAASRVSHREGSGWEGPGVAATRQAKAAVSGRTHD